MASNTSNVSSDMESEIKDACRALSQLSRNLNTESRTQLLKIIIDALWHAVTSSKPSILQNLIEHSSDILKTEEGGELLWYTVSNGNIEMAMHLVNAGANLYLRKPHCPRKLSFLHVISEQIYNEESRGYLKLAILMMDKGADLNARDSSDTSVLYHAVLHESFSLVEELVRRGAVINPYIESPHTCALLLAIQNPYHRDKLLELLVYGVSDDATRNERAIFLAEYYIINGGDAMFVKLFLDRGLPVDFMSPFGSTLLNTSVACNRIEVVQLLLDRGAKINNVTDLGYSPLLLAVCLPDPHITVLLINRGADIHVSNQQGESAIHMACESRSVKNINLLLQLGADINEVNKRGQTPFSLIEFDVLSIADFVVVKHLALSQAKGNKIHESDINFILMQRQTKRLYKNCVSEINIMKNRKIVNNIPYFCFFEKSLSKIVVHVRNKHFVENFNSCTKQNEKLLPIYFEEMKMKFDIAIKLNELLSSVKDFIDECVSYQLPDLVTREISYYMCLDYKIYLQTKFYAELYNTL